MLRSQTFRNGRNLFLILLALTILSACQSSGTPSNTDDDGTVPAPTVTLTAAPSQVEHSGQATLTWSTTNADGCTVTDGWTGTRDPNGSESTGQLTESTAFTIHCTGAGGSVSRSVTVTVVQPSLDFAADRTSVNPGESVTLSWTTSSVESCAASGDWSGNKASNGQETVGPLQADSFFTLSCTTATGMLVETVSVAVASSSQSLSFTSDRSVITAGESVTLFWSANGANSCTASGNWSGSRPTSGQETVGPLQTNSTFTLDCRAATGSLTDTVNISVTAAPSLSFMADRTSINAGESVTLVWSTESVSSCTASGAWSGSRAVNGQETVGPLQVDSAFTLSCNTGSETLAETVNVTVATSGGNLNLEGTVDSSFVDFEALNRVYIFAGNVQPDDYDGDSGDPVATSTVTQDPGACTWSYGLASGLSDGQYTVAFTSDAGDDNPGSNETLNFIGQSTVTVSGGTAVHNFLPSNIVRIGPNRAFTSFSQASLAVSDGAVVEVDAGVYQDDISVWRQDNLTVRGVNGRAHLQAVALIPFSGNDQANGKAIIVTRGDNMRFENIEFSGARVPDLNGAGIRAEGGNLTICNGYFHDNENGILGTGDTILIEYTEFDNNGLGEFGRTHNVYITHPTNRLIFRNNYSHHTNIGHNLKSRAEENHVLYSRLMDEVNGTSSYAIDLPNGGHSYIIGNLLQQGPLGDNNKIIRYGAEGLTPGVTHRVFIVNNTLVNDRQSGTFVTVASGTALAQLTNNLFVGGGTLTSGPIQLTTNLQTNSPGLVDMANYDYRLTAGSPAIDAGSAPGSGDGVSLVPVEQYVHPYDSEARIQSGQIDIGAYEYTP